MSKQDTSKVLEAQKQKEAKSLTSGERVEYTPSRAYGLIFPNGYQMYLNGVLINLIFDGRTYKFTPKVKEYVEKKLELIAFKESEKKELFNNFDIENNKIGKV